MRPFSLVFSYRQHPHRLRHPHRNRLSSFWPVFSLVFSFRHPHCHRRHRRHHRLRLSFSFCRGFAFCALLCGVFGGEIGFDFFLILRFEILKAREIFD